jgi:outer membrane protein assembly factor BamD
VGVLKRAFEKSVIKSIMGCLAGRRAAPLRLGGLLLAVVVAFGLFAGCASVDEQTRVKRDPQEVYDTAMKAYVERSYEEAEEGFKLLTEDYPLNPFAIEAQLMLADVCFAQERYPEAGSYYTNFVALHPVHQRASYALFQKGMSYFKDVLSYDRDQTFTKKALFAFEDLVEAYPESMYREKAEELIVFLTRRLAKRELAIARFYFKGKNYEGALSRFRDILEQYPEAGMTDETLYYIGETYKRLGEEQLSREAFMMLITDFPDSPFVKSARSRLEDS